MRSSAKLSEGKRARKKRQKSPPKIFVSKGVMRNCELTARGIKSPDDLQKLLRDTWISGCPPISGVRRRKRITREEEVEHGRLTSREGRYTLIKRLRGICSERKSMGRKGN